MNNTIEKSYILLKNDHYELLPCPDVEFTHDQMKDAIKAEILDFPTFQDPMKYLNDKYVAGHLRGVVDDNGALAGKEINRLATFLYDPWHSVIFGDVLLGFDVEFDDGEFELCPIPALFLQDVCKKLDRLILADMEALDNVSGSDFQLGKYDVEVMNGKGYYDSNGKYVAFSQYDIFGDPIS